jgi:hypothetical protein
MPQEAEYKIITANGPEIQNQLDVLAKSNWKPILMTAVGTVSSGPVAISVILEHKLQ